LIYGYARVSPDGQSVDAQVRQLHAAGAEKVYRETVSGAKTERTQLSRSLDRLNTGDTLMVTRLDRLARSTRDLLNVLAAVAGKGAGFRSLGDKWADTTRLHGRLMLTVLGGPGRVRARAGPHPHQRGPSARQGTRCEARPQAQANGPPEAGGHQTPRRQRRKHAGHRAQLQR
jgi:hypothetical protein